MHGQVRITLFKNDFNKITELLNIRHTIFENYLKTDNHSFMMTIKLVDKDDE